MLSVVIPAYEMNGRGYEFLHRALYSIPIGHEVIVSDDSDLFEGVCRVYHPMVKYFHNERTKGASGNLNNALDHATGDIIKVLFQDDELGPIDTFLSIKDWGFCTSKHNNGRIDHIPHHPPSLRELSLGHNSYGSPSAMAFRRTDVRFDESLKWLMDVDFYVRMTLRYGPPDIVDTHVKITEWSGSATNTVCTGAIRLRESEYIRLKYVNL